MAMKPSRAMHTENTIEIHGDVKRIFQVAAQVDKWPEILPHYRWVRVLQRKRIDHGRENAHVVAGHTLDALSSGVIAADDIAAANHHTLLDAMSVHAAHLIGQADESRRIVTELALAHQCLARQLEEHAAKARWMLGHLGHAR